MPGTESAGTYPSDREAEVTLRDGSTVHVRPVRPDDKLAIREFLEGVSPESIGFRFFGAINLDWVTAWAVAVDYPDRFALVAETGTPRRIIAHAAYIKVKPALPDGETATAEHGHAVCDRLSPNQSFNCLFEDVGHQEEDG